MESSFKAKVLCYLFMHGFICTVKGCYSGLLLVGCRYSMRLMDVLEEMVFAIGGVLLSKSVITLSFLVASDGVNCVACAHH